MKTDAGWKLWTRKPSAAPAVIAASDAGAVAVQVEGDDRERDRADRADARREPVDAVGEVHDVHDATRPRTVTARRRRRNSRAPMNGSVMLPTSTPGGDRDASPPRSGPASFTGGGRSKRSSSAPTSVISAAPGEDPAHPVADVAAGSRGRAATRRAPEEDRERRPAAACCPSPGRGPSGMSTAPTRAAKRAVSGVSSGRDGEGRQEGVDRVGLSHRPATLDGGPRWRLTRGARSGEDRSRGQVPVPERGELPWLLPSSSTSTTGIPRSTTTVVGRMDLGGRVAPGALFHAAGPGPAGGWRVVRRLGERRRVQRLRRTRRSSPSRSRSASARRRSRASRSHETIDTGASRDGITFVQVVRFPSMDAATFNAMDDEVTGPGLPDELTFHVNGAVGGDWMVSTAGRPRPPATGSWRPRSSPSPRSTQRSHRRSSRSSTVHNTLAPLS